MTLKVKVGCLQLNQPTPNGYTYIDSPQMREALAEFIERVEKGQVYCELGIPQRHEHERIDDFFKRVRTIDPTRVAAKIHSLKVDDEGNITGEISPYGPMCDEVFLKDRNIQMGLRGFTVGARKVNILEIITFDVVGLE